MKSINTIKDKWLLAILADVRAAVVRLFGNKLERVILYGSHARGDHDPESDIDVLILVDDNENNLRQYEARVSDIMNDLSMRYEVIVSLTEEIYSRYSQCLDVLPYFRNINDEGIEVYGRKAA